MRIWLKSVLCRDARAWRAAGVQQQGKPVTLLRSSLTRRATRQGMDRSFWSAQSPASRRDVKGVGLASTLLRRVVEDDEDVVCICRRVKRAASRHQTLITFLAGPRDASLAATAADEPGVMISSCLAVLMRRNLSGSWRACDIRQR